MCIVKRLSALLIFLMINLTLAQNNHGLSSIEPLRAKIIGQTGHIQVWSKSTQHLDTLASAAQIILEKTLILPEKATLHLTFEPLIEVIITGPATIVLNNLAIERSSGTIRMLFAIEKGMLEIKAPPQPGHLLLFSCKTPSVILDASTVQLSIRVDTSGTTTTDIFHGIAKVLPGSGTIRTTIKTGDRSICYPNSQQMQLSTIPKEITAAKPASSANKQPTIGILSIHSSQKTGESLEPISNQIAHEFESATSAKILFLDDIRKLLHSEGNDRLLTCYSDSCISKIGSTAGVDIVIVGNISKLGSTQVLDLKMIDVLRDKILTRTSIRVNEDLGLILTEIPKAIAKLASTDSVLTSVVQSQTSTNTASDKLKYQEKVIWIFPGSYSMGSQYKTGDVDELPTHRVELGGFFIDRFEVTRSEFEKVMGFNPVPSRGCENCPVTNVTWQEANDYCKKLGKRLPTEAEWEYACRGSTNSPFYTGVTLSAEQANFNGQQPFGGSPAGKFNGKVVPVGDYPPNAWNLHDMYGNVAEWCSDWYDVAYYGNSPEKNPPGPASGTLKVVRGGSWSSTGADVRSANRIAYNPGLRLNTIGFRCVKSDESDNKKKR